MSRYIFRVFTEDNTDGVVVCVDASFYTEAENRIKELYPNATQIIKTRVHHTKK